MIQRQNRPTLTYLLEAMNLIIDDNDIDKDGNGIGPILGCLNCKSVGRSKWRLGDYWMTIALYCDECLETLVNKEI